MCNCVRSFDKLLRWDEQSTIRSTEITEVYLDISKAFEIVSHKTLRGKLRSCVLDK